MLDTCNWRSRSSGRRGWRGRVCRSIRSFAEEFELDSGSSFTFSLLLGFESLTYGGEGSGRSHWTVRLTLLWCIRRGWNGGKSGRWRRGGRSRHVCWSRGRDWILLRRRGTSRRLLSRFWQRRRSGSVVWTYDFHLVLFWESNRLGCCSFFLSSIAIGRSIWRQIDLKSDISSERIGRKRKTCLHWLWTSFSSLEEVLLQWSESNYWLQWEMKKKIGEEPIGLSSGIGVSSLSPSAFFGNLLTYFTVFLNFLCQSLSLPSAGSGSAWEDRFSFNPRVAKATRERRNLLFLAVPFRSLYIFIAASKKLFPSSTFCWVFSPELLSPF